MPVELDPLVAAQLTRAGSDALHAHLSQAGTPGVLENQYARLAKLLNDTFGKAQDIAHDPRLTPAGRREDLLSLGRRAMQEANDATEALLTNTVNDPRANTMKTASLKQPEPAMAPALRQELVEAAATVDPDKVNPLANKLTLEERHGFAKLSTTECLLLAAADEPDVPVLLAVEQAGQWWRDLHHIRRGVVEHAMSWAARRSNPKAAEVLEVLDELERLLEGNLATYRALLARKLDLTPAAIDPANHDAPVPV